MIGVGAVICGVSLLGFIGVHKKTIFLSLTFIVLLLISILLQTASLLIMAQRHKELLEAPSLRNKENLDEGILQFQVKLLLLEASSVISVSALVLSLAAAFMRSKLSKKEMMKAGLMDYVRACRKFKRGLRRRFNEDIET